ncbi:SMP-30/gluconolactonase/LRE family protein [Fodinicurvata sp. EGI_FJ10296]|uniref:SMP-30/gluconolactonase/LRE family protein n=1 Tax=Fodinicurvata sp. EGI_FJ10296 TaxID=3231908 RepID=UPI00345171E2
MAEIDGTKGAGSLRKALSLLEIVRTQPNGMSMQDLVAASGLARPTAYRMVGALTEEAFLSQDSETKAVSLGPKLLELAQSVWRDQDLRGVARGELALLARRTGATALLMVRSQNMMTCIELSKSEPALQDWHVGTALPVNNCAGGMAVLAFGDWEQLDHELESLGVADPRAFKSRLGVARSRFYATDNPMTPTGLAGVAAPVFDFSGVPVAAICLYGDATSSLHDLGAAVVQAARNISRARGGYPFGLEISLDQFATPDRNVTCLADSHCLIGDNPIVEHNQLIWVDILAPAAIYLNEETGEIRRRPMSEVVGALLHLEPGRFLAAQQSRLSILDLEGTEIWQRSAPGLQPGFRYNDGAIDSEGRIWLGVMDMAATSGTGQLHCYEELDGDPSTLPGFSLPNGIAFSEGGERMYVIDSMERTLSIFTYDKKTSAAYLEQRVELLARQSGRPSGLARGPGNSLFTCHWDGGKILQITSDGRCIDEFHVPVPRPSGVTYDEGNNRLIVTSARARLSEADVDAFPLSGGTFSITLDRDGQ